MPKEKLIKIIEGFDSAGYEIVKIDELHNPYYKYYEILLSPPSTVKEPLSKEKMINLFEVLSSNGYGILKYELLPDNNCDIFYRDIKLVLQII